ncbi:hypothetical protein [His 1 virus]|uniref:Uncharacterized protein ORF2 n=1 Tax=His1 virus (isolate Australia/Victoria) TaxID=654912 RepID=Y002_HIS1I|nr:hypothetical protein His1V_gp02 [His 1 virus]Q25BJ3.1 RecName: Full=Uncharacterized protein ORF2 [His1 virus (isolate Victoria)]AAQ13717.1 hypothetical protein [His 1 virus]
MRVKLEHSERGMVTYSQVKKIRENDMYMKIYQEGGYHRINLVNIRKRFIVSGDKEKVSLCLGGCKPIFKGEYDSCPECGAEVRIKEVK